MKPRFIFLAGFVLVVLILALDPQARPNIPLPHAQPAVASAPAQITGKPTIDAAFINRVLSSANSPADGTGEALYNDGVQYGINPAYALAFFKHESNFGTTGVARYTLSLGNIKCTSGYSCIDGFRAYSSWAAGYQDWYKLISTLYINQWHLVTLEKIIPVYAPSSDGNSPQDYINAVESDVQRWQKGEV